jgi:DNA-binding GntR family transcriptional regulator
MPEGSPVVQRSSLREQIADALRDEMLTGRLPAGQRFTVKEIAELYEVSATPVREALVDLAAQGLLEVEHHRGFTVRRFTLAEFEDLVAARELIVDGLFRMTARCAKPVPPEALASVRRRGEASVRAALANQLDVLIGCDLRFWRELTTLIGNRHIHAFLDRLRVQAWMFCVPYLRKHGDLVSVCWTEHTALVDSMADHDVPRMREVLDDFNKRSRDVMRALAGPRSRALEETEAPVEAESRRP